MRTMRTSTTADHFPSPPLVFASSAGYNVTVVMLKTTAVTILALAPESEHRREQHVEHTQEMIREPQGEVSCTLWQLVRSFLKLGTFGFGGPVALVGSMRRDLVESRKWISETDYQEGLALAQFSPGPLAAQLAMYVGYVRSRRLGATAVGLAFIWPFFWGKYLLRAVVFGSSSPCQADRSAQDDGLHASALQRAADPGGLCTDLSAGSSAAPGSSSTFTNGCAYAPGVYDGVGLPSGVDCRGLCDLPRTQCRIGNQSGHLRLALTGTGSRAWDTFHPGRNTQGRLRWSSLAAVAPCTGGGRNRATHRSCEHCFK